MLEGSCAETCIGREDRCRGLRCEAPLLLLAPAAGIVDGDAEPLLGEGCKRKGVGLDLAQAPPLYEAARAAAVAASEGRKAACCVAGRDGPALQLSGVVFVPPQSPGGQEAARLRRCMSGADGAAGSGAGLCATCAASAASATTTSNSVLPALPKSAPPPPRAARTAANSSSALAVPPLRRSIRAARRSAVRTRARTRRMRSAAARRPCMRAFSVRNRAAARAAARFFSVSQEHRHVARQTSSSAPPSTPGRLRSSSDSDNPHEAYV